MNKLIQHIIFFSIILIFASCANIQAPSGGPPDTTPPEIEQSTPKNLSLEVKERKVKLRFSKYMNKNAVLENIYILPSIKANYDWSGKDLTIEFDEEFKPNTTYSINIGSDYTDLKGNKPLESFNLIFSSGNHIDSGVIVGKIIYPNPQGLFVFAYNISNINADTLNPTVHNPEYKVQSGSSGNFSIKGLPDGKYRLFAVQDKFKDGSISDGQDLYACSYADAELIGGKSKDIFFRFGLNVDTASPKLYSAEAFSDRKLKLYFSENVIIDSLSAACIKLLDSASNESFGTLSVYPDFKSKNIINVITSEPLKEKQVYFASITQENCSIKDTSGLEFNEFGKEVRFIGAKDMDSSQFVLLERSIKDSSEYHSPSLLTKFTFSEPIDSVSHSLISYFNISDSLNVKFKTKIENQCELIIYPENPLKYNTRFNILIKPEAIHRKFGQKNIDKDISLTFKTEDNRSFGGASGRLIDSTAGATRKILVLESASGSSRYQTEIDSLGNWKFDNLKSGNYIAWVFADENADGQYNYGKLFPFEFAEKFYLTNQEINIKSRWEIEGIIIRIGE